MVNNSSARTVHLALKFHHSYVKTDVSPKASIRNCMSEWHGGRPAFIAVLKGSLIFPSREIFSFLFCRFITKLLLLLIASIRPIRLSLCFNGSECDFFTLNDYSCRASKG